MNEHDKVPLLDHGYLQLIEQWGSDQLGIGAVTEAPTYDELYSDKCEHRVAGRSIGDLS